MPFLSPNQQCRIKARKGIIIFHGLAYPKLTWGSFNLALTTNSSWLPWGRVAMPLISRTISWCQYPSKTASLMMKIKKQRAQILLTNYATYLCRQFLLTQHWKGFEQHFKLNMVVVAVVYCESFPVVCTGVHCVVFYMKYWTGEST